MFKRLHEPWLHVRSGSVLFIKQCNKPQNQRGGCFRGSRIQKLSSSPNHGDIIRHSLILFSQRQKKFCIRPCTKLVLLKPYTRE